MRFSELLARSGIHPAKQAGDAEVLDLCDDSRKAKLGDLFVCMPSLRSDSHEFLASAKQSGVSAALTHTFEGFERASELGIATALVPNYGWQFQDCVWKLCRTFFGDPSAKLLTIGVTGTNGKTTTAWLLRDLLNSVGRSSAYLGTLGLHFGSRVEELNNTTPFAIETFRLLCELTSQGCDSIAMEVSSHALVERRADGIAFDTAVFTNLTQDHLDYHGSMANYEAAKWRLFRELPEVNAKTFVPAFNVGDVTGMRWWRTFPTGSVPFAVHCSESTEFDDETLVARPKVVAIDHLEFDLWRMGSVEGTVRCRLGGSYNLENVMAAIASMIAAGFELDDVIAGCEHLRPVPGRFEVVSENHEVSVLVDYAHTPDALVKLLHAVRPLTDGRVITVFGCGGDRDRSKRPKMARAASSLSDITLVTSDNPRTEDPEAILTEVVEGIVRGRHYERVVDRSRAIERAIELAEPGDVVVVAGKGHENYQIIGRTKYPMDDREMAREALANWRGAIA